MQVASVKFIFVAALSIAAAAASVASHAETYEGVHSGGSMMNRAAVVQGAIEVARAGNLYGDLAGSGVLEAPVATASRADVRREAIAAARMGNIYGEYASSRNVSQLFAADRADALQAKAATLVADPSSATVNN